jgi:hypothetical protein
MVFKAFASVRILLIYSVVDTPQRRLVTATD